MHGISLGNPITPINGVLGFACLMVGKKYSPIPNAVVKHGDESHGTK